MKKCEKKKIWEVQIFYEGNRGRAVGKLMKINKSTVYNFIKSLSKKIEESKQTIKFLKK